MEYLFSSHMTSHDASNSSKYVKAPRCVRGLNTVQFLDLHCVQIGGQLRSRTATAPLHFLQKSDRPQSLSGRGVNKIL